MGWRKTWKNKETEIRTRKKKNKGSKRKKGLGDILKERKIRRIKNMKGGERAYVSF